MDENSKRIYKELALLNFRMDEILATVQVINDSRPKNAEHSELVRGAIRRMRSAPPLLSRDEYKNLTSYDGPVVNGDPEGRLPDNLEEDDDDGVAE